MPQRKSSPATLAHPSRFPNLATVCSIHALTLSNLEISATQVQYRPLASGNSLSISSTALARFSAEVAHPETVAPLASRYLHNASPTPRLAPVTAITLLANGCGSTAYGLAIESGKNGLR